MSDWYYAPPNTTSEQYGRRVEILRPPRDDVKSPTVRIRVDGEERSVPLRHLTRRPPGADTYLEEARGRPVWRRLVNLSEVTLRAEQELHSEREYLADEAVAVLERACAAAQQNAEHRARQLAGTIAPRGAPAHLRTNITTVLLDAARSEASRRDLRAKLPTRTAAPAPHALVLQEDAARAHLDQGQRAMINRIALSLHRRYFLSDKELYALTDAEREHGKVHGILRQIIALGERETGLPHTSSASGPRNGSTLYGELHDHLVAANRAALEACTALLAGHADDALTLALQVREHRLQYLAAEKATQQRRVKHGTGRYFHGDILSVREEHVRLDENGNFAEYDGMTQYYARVIVLYGPDGHSVQIANSDELEAVTATRAGPQAWSSLARWITDMSERAGGRKQGRRHDDDMHLIYRDNDGHLRLRDTLKAYPDLVTAFDVIRRALHVDLATQDITPGELGEAPAPGHHQHGRREDVACSKLPA